jgi:hypothetical protein
MNPRTRAAPRRVPFAVHSGALPMTGTLEFHV